MTDRWTETASQHMPRVARQYKKLMLHVIEYFAKSLKITQGHYKFQVSPFESLGTVSYSSSIITMALSCIDDGRKSQFFIPLAFDAPVRGAPVRVLPHRLVQKKIEWCKKFDDMFSRFDKTPACDRQMDRQTSCNGKMLSVHLSISDIGSCNSTARMP